MLEILLRNSLHLHGSSSSLLLISRKCSFVCVERWYMRSTTDRHFLLRRSTRASGRLVWVDCVDTFSYTTTTTKSIYGRFLSSSKSRPKGGKWRCGVGWERSSLFLRPRYAASWFEAAWVVGVNERVREEGETRKGSECDVMWCESEGGKSKQHT